MKGDSLNNLIYFDIGCRKCSHLVPVGNNTFVCSRLTYDDDSSIYPIVNGEKTDDWDACSGKDREFRPTRKRASKRSC